MKKRLAIHTLGCKVNFCESESLGQLFSTAGYRLVSFEEEAEVYLVNTCSVTASSDHKSRKALRRAVRRAPPGALVLATGCYAQRAPEEVAALGGISLVTGTTGRGDLPSLLHSLEKGTCLNRVIPHRQGNPFESLPLPRRRGRTRGFLKIQDGCNQGCSYCVVPAVRGPLRSLPPAEAVRQAEELVSSGCREIVLTGIHLGLYGAGEDSLTLAGLLRKLVKIKKLSRLRLSSLEPSDITTELVEAISESPKVCPHLHLPLQSGDETILEAMNRPYSPTDYLYLARWLKGEIPGLAISSDVMVGFPGETETHHRRSMALVSAVGFSSLHVFQFSPRPGTPAALLPGRPSSWESKRRSREMMALGEEMAASYRRNFFGSVQPVLVEKVFPHEKAEGYTPHYLRVSIHTACQALRWRNRVINVRLEQEETGGVLRGVRVHRRGR